MNEALEKENYLSEARAVFGGTVYEYDIKQANINILYSYNLISDFEYQWLQLAPKSDRNWYIGKKAQMDIVYNGKTKSDINRAISEGVLKARRLLVESNNIQLDQILRAAKDSVFVNRTLPLNTLTFDLNGNNRPIVFTLRNIYDHYVRFENGIIIMIADKKSSFDVEVKGIDDKLLPLHHDFISVLAKLIYIRSYNKEASLKEFNQFYENYVSLKCPVNMYRELSSASGFRYKNNLHLMIQPMPLVLPDDFDKTILDISCNLSILRELYVLIYNN